MKTMTESEGKKLFGHICKCDVYLEFGSGESTIVAAEDADLEHIITVESDQAWFNNNVGSNDEVSWNWVSGFLRPYFPHIGPVGDWGHPVGFGYEHLWPSYSLGVFADPDAKRADLVLVDGRFRVACILACLLTLGPETVILVHDYRGRDHYHVVEPFVEIVDTVDTMVELRALEGFDRGAASVLLKEALYDPR